VIRGFAPRKMIAVTCRRRSVLVVGQGRWLAIACASWALSAACRSPAGLESDNLGSVPDGAFTTDATGYVAVRIPGQPRYRFTVITRYENRGVVTLYLGRCFPNSPQPLFGAALATPGTGESAYATIWACVGHDKQFAIEPGEVRLDTLQVEGPNSFDGRTHEPFGVTEGDFRLYFDVRLNAGDGGPDAPDALKLSNAFRVRTSG
jgi:hypothetical protein